MAKTLASKYFVADLNPRDRSNPTDRNPTDRKSDRIEIRKIVTGAESFVESFWDVSFPGWLDRASC